MYRKALSIRRADGQVKQCEVRYKEDTRNEGQRMYTKKSGRDVFMPRRKISDYIDGTQTLVVCEKTNVSLDEPFVRKLPACLSHTLFFGDLLLCYHDDSGTQKDLLVEDFVQITQGRILYGA